MAGTPLHTVCFIYEQVLELYAINLQWKQYGRRVAEAHGQEPARRAFSFQLKSAAAHYAELIYTRTHLFNKLTINQLSSYLGMATETLSRLRRAKAGG